MNNNLDNPSSRGHIPQEISSAFRPVANDEEADIIQMNYERYARKAGIYAADIYSHLLNGYGIVFSPYNQTNSFLVGNFIDRTFCVSHFAPENMREGVVILLELLHGSTPAVFAVPKKLSDQLVKLGYERIFRGVPMQFRGEVMEKDICVNHSVSQRDLLILLDKWMREAQESNMLSKDPKVQRFFSLLGKVRHKLLKNTLSETGVGNNADNKSKLFPDVLFHATPENNLPSIKQYGLGGRIPKDANKLWDYSGTKYSGYNKGVFLEMDAECAYDFVEASDTFWKTKERYEQHGKELKIVIFSIDTKLLDRKLLVKDTNNRSNDSTTFFYNGIIPYSRLRIL